MALNKVYIVTSQEGSYEDDAWHIYCICSSRKKAEREKKRLEDTINGMKSFYRLKFKRDYEEGLLDASEMTLDDEMEFYKFQHEHPELKYHTILIEEKELL